LTQSLEEYKAAQAAHQDWTARTAEHLDNSDSGVDTDYDDDFKRVVEESKRLHTENEQKKKDLSEREAALVTIGDTALTTEPAELQDDDDDELKRAITESEQHEKLRQENVTLQRSEEDIVLDYVKKQSLLEQELKSRAAGQGTETPPSTT